ncbi:ribosome maturation factor RimM [Micrococcoides hystricis]|uniref:Ribosome maturation factor RimM n=1 Tax=Micrococcoides hystricis TaxID=1572761 RepID=A0ABV6PC58_9MICC
MTQQPQEQLHLARIGKPHGIKGEVTVQVFTDNPEERFVKGAVFTCDHADYPNLTLSSARWNKNILLLGFAEFKDRNTAELLRNHHLYTDELLEEDDAWYEHEFIDIPVFHNNKQIGKVTALLTGPVQDLLEVELSDGKEVLIPLVAEIVTDIDLDQRRITVDPPAGLLEMD